MFIGRGVLQDGQKRRDMGPGKIEIKDINVLRGLMEHTFHHVLIDVQCYIAEKYGILITESYRPKRHKNDVHGTNPVRANDNRLWCYAPENLAYEIQQDVNNKWCYDPERPRKQVVIIHDTGNGIHFHVQVHPGTVLR